MEVRGQRHGHAPPFWANSSSSPTTSTNASTSTQSGIRPWVVVVVLCIVVLLFFPSVVSSPFKTGRLGSIKSGWDMLNVCLVVFAIACGVLGRIGEGSGGQDLGGSFKQLQQQQVRSEWNGTGYSDANRAAAAMSRRMMMMRSSSSSYPDLRTETAAVWGQSNRMGPDSWHRPYDDDRQLHRAWGRPVQMYHQMPGFGEEERECKTVSVDTESGMGTVDYGQEWRGREVTVVARRRMRSLEALPKWEQEDEQNGRRRRRSLERFPSIEENMEKEIHFHKMEAELGADDHRMVEEQPPVEEEEEDEEEMVKRTEESLPEIEEVVKDGSFEEENVAAEKTPVVVEVTPPPPPPLEAKLAEECGKHRRSGSGGGGTKDLASAIALFYQKKKKGSKSKRKDQKHEQPSSIVESNPNSNSVTESNNGNASGGTVASTAPPPPPPASSIFHQLFSNKKGASKSRRIHSLSASTYSCTPSAVNAVSAPPPPTLPMPRPPHQGSHRARKNEVASTGYRRIEDTELYHEHRRTRERSNLSPYARYPLPPRSPLPPPPPSPPPVCENVTEKIGSPAVSCPSPDVNDKADLFIRRFRDGLELEKINSIKEKVKRKEIGGEYDEIQT